MGCKASKKIQKHHKCQYDSCSVLQTVWNVSFHSLIMFLQGTVRCYNQNIESVSWTDELNQSESFTTKELNHSEWICESMVTWKVVTRMNHFFMNQTLLLFLYAVFKFERCFKFQSVSHIKLLKMKLTTTWVDYCYDTFMLLFHILELAWVLIHFNSIENMARVFLQNSSLGINLWVWNDMRVSKWWYNFIQQWSFNSSAVVHYFHRFVYFWFFCLALSPIIFLVYPFLSWRPEIHNCLVSNTQTHCKPQSSLGEGKEKQKHSREAKLMPQIFPFPLFN